MSPNADELLHMPKRGPWEVRDNHDEMLEGADPVYRVERGAGEDLEVAALGITDFGIAEVVATVANVRDGTVE